MKATYLQNEMIILCLYWIITESGVSNAFVSPKGLRQATRISPFHPAPLNRLKSRNMASDSYQDGDWTSDLEPLATAKYRLTPEGYGFSSAVGRILKEAGRQGGYYRADASEPVLDVIAAITQDRPSPDAALVYGKDNQLLGIFTEADYIRVRALGVEPCSLSLAFSYLPFFSHYSFLPVELSRLNQKKKVSTFYPLLFRDM
jgi:hypothetical protein